MPNLPPLLRAELSLDRMRLVLLSAEPPWHNPWPGIAASAFGLLAAVTMLALGQPLLSLVIAAGAAGIGWVRVHRSPGHRPVILTLMQNRIKVDERDLFTGDVVEVAWRCTSPTTRLVLIRADGSEEEALHVLRRTFNSPGVTRKQRDWIAAQIVEHRSSSSEADIPEELGTLRAEAEG